MFRYDLSEQYLGVGVSSGLNRGLLVYLDDRLLVEEGMGIGRSAIQAGGFTYFTSIGEIGREADRRFSLISKIDIRLEYTVFGVRSRLLTRILELIATRIYMKRERIQKRLLQIGETLRFLFRVSLAYVPVRPIGEVRIEYRTDQSGISVELRCNCRKPNYKLFIMNELSGSLFCQGLIDGQAAAPPSGWNRLPQGCELYSPLHALALSIAEDPASDPGRSRLFWGREVTGLCNWAGFESELRGEAGQDCHYQYRICFRKVDNA